MLLVLCLIYEQNSVDCLTELSVFAMENKISVVSDLVPEENKLSLEHWAKTTEHVGDSIACMN